MPPSIPFTYKGRTLGTYTRLTEDSATIHLHGHTKPITAYNLAGLYTFYLPSSTHFLTSEEFSLYLDSYLTGVPN